MITPGEAVQRREVDLEEGLKPLIDLVEHSLLTATWNGPCHVVSLPSGTPWHLMEELVRRFRMAGWEVTRAEDQKDCQSYLTFTTPKGMR